MTDLVKYALHDKTSLGKFILHLNWQLWRYDHWYRRLQDCYSLRPRSKICQQRYALFPRLFKKKREKKKDLKINSTLTLLRCIRSYRFCFLSFKRRESSAVNLLSSLLQPNLAKTWPLVEKKEMYGMSKGEFTVHLTKDKSCL